jgi:uncharacterized repeat protein (TIGR03803 family)
MLRLLPAIFLLLTFAALPRARAQQYEIRHEFLPSPALPYAGLIKGQDGNFYGTTFGNGQNGDNGSVFKITPTGVATTLHSFSGRDGRLLYSGVIQASDGNFYGTTWKGGAPDMGTVFKVDSNGAVTTLHSFVGNDGAYPIGGVTRGSDGNFYGTTVQGGSANKGTVFKISAAGVLTTLHQFAGPDGQYPEASQLLQAPDGKFYGTTYQGGASSVGTVYRIDSSGAFAVVHSFAGQPLDAGYPVAGLILGSDGNFYGTSYGGGAANNGATFKMTSAGAVTLLHSFTVTDGALPFAPLMQASDGNFYGTTQQGGPANGGTIFKMDANGVVTTVHSFVGPEGSGPTAPLIEGSGGNLYSTTYYNGPYVTGTVYKIDFGGNLTTLYSFPGGDGWWPYAAPIQTSDGNFYGTTWQGGVGNKGSIYKMDSAGALSILHSFAGEPLEGRQPQPQLVRGSDGNFYGTTYYGGAANNGTIFKVDSSGNLTTLHSFAGVPADGAHPFSPLIQASDGNFYGTTFLGGSGNLGTVFKMDPAGSVTILHSFASTDGSYVFAGLIQGKDGNLYGATYVGGASDKGTIFKMDFAGNLTTLHSFNGADGWYPYGTLIQASDGNFYGTTLLGGDANVGTIFKIDGSGAFALLHSFNGLEGSKPEAGVFQASDGNLYGTTPEGGPAYSATVLGNGTVFKMDLSGNFTVIHNFTGLDGSTPIAGVMQAIDGNLYGATATGGTFNLGVIFRINTAPPVQLLRAVSRKTHGDAGTFDVDLTTGTGAIECRSSGGANAYTLVFRFPNNLTGVGSASVSGVGSVSSSTIDSSDAHQYLVDLTGVTNAQAITVSLTNVSDSAGGFSSIVSASMKVLVGDTNGDGFVNSGDIAQTKSQSGISVTSSNFREDLTADGSINSGDIGLVKSKSGTAFP